MHLQQGHLYFNRERSLAASVAHNAVCVLRKKSSRVYKNEGNVRWNEQCSHDWQIKARPCALTFDHEHCTWAIFPNNTKPLTEIASDPLNFQLLCETSMPSNEAFSVASKIHAALVEVWPARVKACGIPTHTLKEMSITLLYTSSNRTWHSSQKLFLFNEISTIKTQVDWLKQNLNFFFVLNIDSYSQQGFCHSTLVHQACNIGNRNHAKKVKKKKN